MRIERDDRVRRLWTPARPIQSQRFRRRLIEIVTAYLFFLPAGLILFTFQYLPAIELVRLSLTNRLLLRPRSRFVGLDNFQRMLEDDRFWNAVWNTVYFVLGSATIQTLLALLFALFLARQIRGVVVMRTAFFLPVVASLVAMATIWKWMYHPNLDVGLFNMALSALGFSPVDWLRDPNLAMPSLILLAVWSGTGYYMILFLAGILDIPKVYYEAALIDGANAWQSFRSITLPLLTPVSYLILILQVINSFQVFSSVYVMTGGGPARKTEVIVYYIYQRAFESFEFGYASALSVVLFLFLLGVSIVQRFTFGRRVVYDR
jgi:multiple sugar transport system permease protein